MGQLIKYVFLGVLVDLVLFALHNVFSTDIFANTVGNHIMQVLYLLGITIPCVIYYIKMPPGTDTRP